MNKIKTLYISPNGYLGGAERIVCNISKGHQNTDSMEFDFLFFSNGAAVELCRQYGVTTYVLPYQFRLSRVFKLIKALLYLRKFIKTNKYDLLHSTMPYAHIVIFLATIFMPVKRVWFQHGPVGGVLDKIANWLPVDLIYFNSNYLEAEHLKMFGASRNQNKHKIINYGIDDTKVSDSNVLVIKELYKERFKTIFLSAGRLCPWKGQDKLLIAFNNLLSKNEKFKKENVLLIVGDVGRETDKSYAESLYSYVIENNLSDNIEFLGHKGNVQDYYSASDVFIHSSLIPEPFGLVVAESMKNGCFVIGSNIGGISDILINGETGINYDSTGEDCVNQLKKAIMEYCELVEKQESRVESIKLSAKKMIDGNYSIQSMCDTLEKDIIHLCS